VTNQNQETKERTMKYTTAPLLAAALLIPCLASPQSPPAKSPVLPPAKPPVGPPVWPGPSQERKPGPDLVVADIATRDPIIVGRPNQLVVQVANVGDKNAGAFEVAVSGAGTSRRLGLPLLQANSPLARARLTMDWTPQADGPYRFTAKVDADDKVREAREDNNSRATELFPPRGMPRPDLDIRLSHTRPVKAGQATTITVNVANVSDKAAVKNFVVVVRGPIDQKWTFPALKPARSFEQSFSFTPTHSPRPFVFKARADVTNVIGEMSEANNESELEIIVKD
jgi:subtilase family serine protease